MHKARGATVDVVCDNKQCRRTFTARVADRRRGWARHCSKSCKAVVQEKRTGQYADMIHRRGRTDSWEDGETFANAHLFSNEEHDCNKD